MSELEKAGKSASSIKSILVVLTTLFAVTGSIVAGYGFLDEKYAHAEDVKKLEKRLTLTELKTSLRTAQEEYYFEKAQLRKYPDDVELQDRVRETAEVVKDLKEQIKLRGTPLSP